ncbi:DUF3693 domain-containing protein [Stenotrophomonas maltophilia]|nr:DUF3693 domain-containing protein [Stenotrophomonas maltophilia]UGB48162.1 DUF3693 domain-containing protein [Stenotrophomonas maltophilia]
MTAVNELLDNVKIRLNLASDMALAERLTVTRSLVSRWRKGDTPLADERIAQICALAKLDGPTWIAMIHAERATSATERALWRLMLDRMSAAAAVVALIALSMPGLANAKTAQIQAVSGAENGGMYIMFRPESHCELRLPQPPPCGGMCPPRSWRLRLLIEVPLTLPLLRLCWAGRIAPENAFSMPAGTR